MIIDVSDLQLNGLSFVVTRADGATVDFSQLVTDFVWSDHVNVAGAEVSIEAEGDPSLVNQIGMEGSTSMVLGVFPDLVTGQMGRREMWRGFFEEVVDERRGAAQSRQITGYDIGKMLATDEEDYVLRGETLSQVVRRVCTDFSVPVLSLPETAQGLGNIICRGETLWQGVFQKAIQRHKDLTGEVWRIRFERGGLVLLPQGGLDHWWIFEVGRSLLTTRRTRSIADLENRVRVYGQVSEDLAKPLVEADIQNEQSQGIYGLRQRVEYLASADDRQKVFDLAEQRINKNSIPLETIEITGWAVPLLRAGDQVQVEDSEMGLTGTFFVESVECQWSMDSAFSSATLKRQAIDPGLFLDELVVA